MSDDRDRRRFSDGLHPAVTAAGDFDSRDEVTPVGVLRRIEDKIDAAQIARDIDADMPEHFARLEARCLAAERRAVVAEAKAEQALAKWRWPMRVAGGLAAFSLSALTWAVVQIRSSGYEARRAEEQRAAVERHDIELRSIRETLIRFGERLNAWRPVGTVPLVGPHNKDD